MHSDGDSMDTHSTSMQTTLTFSYREAISSKRRRKRVPILILLPPIIEVDAFARIKPP